MAAYTPVSCDFHDTLTLAVMAKKPMRLGFHDAHGVYREDEFLLVDVLSKSGEEFALTSTGEMIRLDRISKVDGGGFDPVAGCPV